MTTINTLCNKYNPRLTAKLKTYLPKAHPLYQDLEYAMAHALFNGGKRIRPLLVYLTGTMLGATLDALDAPACAVEYMHCSSLIHDDLPAMDNAALRRGNPTCHKVYGDDMAILAGDALMILAHEVIADKSHSALSTDQRLNMLHILSRASGASGMVAGQAIDVRNLNQLDNLNDLKLLHRLKTGALIKASVLLGAHASPLLQPQHIVVLTQFAELLGLAFQVQDDILDVCSDTTTLGKPQGIDADNDKYTFTDLLGIDGAKKYAEELVAQAQTQLDTLALETSELNVLARYVLERKC